jgi:hypothetical protein
VLHRCAAAVPEVVLDNSAILRVTSLVVVPKLAEEAHRRSTIMGTVYKKVVSPMRGTRFIPQLLE